MVEFVDFDISTGEVICGVVTEIPNILFHPLSVFKNALTIFLQGENVFALPTLSFNADMLRHGLNVF